jgi:signal transduction histidine kinase
VIPFNGAATISVATAGFAMAGAVTSWVVGRAQGWRELRWFSLVALCTAVYSAGNVATVLGPPDQVVLVTSRLQLAALLVNVWALAQITDDMTATTPSRLERWLRLVLPAGAALSLVPGLAYGLPVTDHAFPPWGAVYRDPWPTPLASVLYLAGLLMGPILALRLWRAWRRGTPGAGLYGLSILVLLAMGISDALSISRVVEAPYLLDVGALFPVGALAWTHIGRFLGDAASLAALRTRLEVLVDQRTRALSQTHAALFSSERLAAFGRFAGGLAHQVNNPAAVVQSGLAYLQGELREGRVPADALQVLDDSAEAMRRITWLVRRLVDAGRMADRPAVAASPVEPVVTGVLLEARRAASQVEYTSQLAPGLVALLATDDLKAVLEAIVSNATAAFPPGGRGRVSVRAVRRDGQVVIEVEDTGAGMSSQVMERAFDPFFTTRAGGHGAAGLGLPVARSLVEAAGGVLHLRSKEGRGTRVVVELPEAPAAEETTDPERQALPPV